jgi:hypothetical protein
MENRTTWTRIMSMVLVALSILVLLLPIASYAFGIRPVSGFGDGAVGNGYITRGGSTTVIGTSNGQLTTTTVTPNSGGYTVTFTTYNHNAKPLSQTVINVGKAQQYTFTTYNTQTTITKTYTQYVYYTTVINNIITRYMMPLIQWEFTLVNIGQLQAPGYHMVKAEKLFTPGSGGNGGIFVPVFAQEAIYSFNVVPSTKPVVTGWYTAGQSQSTTTSTSVSKTPPQLTGIQQTVDTIQQLATVTIPNITRSSVNWIYNTQVISKPYPFTPPPFYYSQADINNAYVTAWSDLTHGNILGAIYQTGRGLYMQGWNTLASAVYSAYQFVQVAQNAFNTASLAKSIGLAFNVLNPFGK